MPERLHRAVDERGIPQVRATDLFPELSDDIDRRIMHSETKIKLWVIGAVLANAMAATARSLRFVGTFGSGVRIDGTNATGGFSPNDCHRAARHRQVDRR